MKKRRKKVQQSHPLELLTYLILAIRTVLNTLIQQKYLMLVSTFVEEFAQERTAREEKPQEEKIESNLSERLEFLFFGL